MSKINIGVKPNFSKNKRVTRNARWDREDHSGLLSDKPSFLSYALRGVIMMTLAVEAYLEYPALLKRFF